MFSNLIWRPRRPWMRSTGDAYLRAMSRTTRHYLPGCAFHITARTQGHQAWFHGICETVERIIFEGFASSDAALMSHAVMPNHLHLVVRQGTNPLAWSLQPILRRIALRVQRLHGVQGHVFERRFRSAPCRTAAYLRNALVYTNLNPRRAGLCDLDGQYPWSSHAAFTSGQCPFGIVDVSHCTKLFLHEADSTEATAGTAYRKYVEWRLEKDRCDLLGISCSMPEPITTGGDTHFLRHFSVLNVTRPRPTQDLRDAARDILARIEPCAELQQLRGRHMTRSRCAIRNQVIAALQQAGYSGGATARFFGVSPATVSKVASRMRVAGTKSKKENVVR